MKHIKKIVSLGLFALLAALTGIVATDKLVKWVAAENIFTSVQEIPHNKVALLLGTRKILPNGHINLYYKYRIEAAVKLFEAGKVDYLLVSGDNSAKDYDEPSTMKADLMAGGIPADKIYLDYAGFRTLDSVVRCKVIFGQTNVTVVSQPFHNERAIFIANRKGIKAIGFNARDVSRRYGLKIQLREKLARVKMMIDLAIGQKPKFLGEQIEIK